MSSQTSNTTSDMFEADAEMSKLKYLPGIDDMTERYRTHVQGVAESYRTAGLANASKKEEEVRGKVGEEWVASYLAGKREEE